MKNIFLGIMLFSCLVAKAQIYLPIDEGSKFHFVIKNFGISTGGDLTGVKGKITFDAKKPTACFFDVTVAVATIDTDNGKRDTHLKREEYFDAEKYPVIHLVSSKIEPGADLKHFIFKGNITIKNSTRPVEFIFMAEGKNGGALFTGSFELNRIDFGIGKESISLSNKVKIGINAFAKAQ